jgi:hypothetical protein
MSSVVITILLAAIVGLVVPVAAMAGRLAERRAWRWAVAGLGLVIAIANHVILEGGYRYVHMFLSFAAAALIGASLSNARTAVAATLLEPAVPRQRWQARVVLSLLVAGAIAAVIAPKSRAVGSELARSDTAVLQTLLSRFGPDEDAAGAVDQVTRSSEWFQARSSHPETPPTPGGVGVVDPIVILITMDAVRAEVLANPAHAKHVPELRALADEAIWFTEARSPGSGTVTTFASLFTGKHHFQLDWRRDSNVHASDRPRQTISNDDSLRFPEALSEAGVHTATVVAFPGLHPDSGVVRGFQDVHFVPPTTHQFALSGPMIDAVIEGIDSSSARKFMFAHLMDPHAPYDSAGGRGFRGYLREAAACSREIGRLIADLKERDLWQRTILIVTADHGEGFKKHKGVPFHNVALYEEIVRVPLIVRVPGLEAQAIDTPVSLIDLGPTILDLYGLPTPGWFMGQTLVPTLMGQEPELTRPLIASTMTGAMAYYDGSRKLIWDKKKRTVELFDLSRDPDERENVADGGGDALLARLALFKRVHKRR